MYIPQNWEFGLACSKLRNFKGGLNPPNQPLGTPVPSFSLCSMKRLAIRHMNRPRFPTPSVLSNIRNWVGLRTYQHHLVYCCVLTHCGLVFFLYIYHKSLIQSKVTFFLNPARRTTLKNVPSIA
jgi:hypothetical protein